MPYLSNEKRYRINSNGFELQEPRKTIDEFFTTIREKKIVSGVGGFEMTLDVKSDRLSYRYIIFENMFCFTSWTLSIYCIDICHLLIEEMVSEWELS